MTFSIMDIGSNRAYGSCICNCNLYVEVLRDNIPRWYILETSHPYEKQSLMEGSMTSKLIASYCGYIGDVGCGRNGGGSGASLSIGSVQHLVNNDLSSLYIFLI